MCLASVASAYNSSIVNVSQRTDGSDLANRGMDALALTFKQSQGAFELGSWIQFILIGSVIVLIIYFFKPSWLRGGR